MESPAKRMRMSAQRRSVLGGTSPNASSSSAARDTLRANVTSRNVAAPSRDYDIITGQPIEQPKMRESTQLQTQIHPLRKSGGSRQSMLPQPQQPVAMVSQQKYQDDTIALQAKLHKLEYELNDRNSEKAMIALQHEKELRELQSRADADHRKYQEAEAERIKAVRQHELAMKEAREVREHNSSDKSGTDRKLRDLELRNEALAEEKEDLEARLNDVESEKRRILVEEVEGKRSRLERTLQETQTELTELKSQFDEINSQFQQKQKDTESLEQTILELNGRVGGGEELDVLRKELTEQMAYVRRLETQNREQGAEIRKLKDERRSVNIVLEEKRALELQVQVLREVEDQASRLEIQNGILEDEKRSWTTLLEKDGEEDGQKEFDSPEAVVKALVNERIERAMIMDRIGVVESELSGKDEALRSVESERDSLRAELTAFKDTKSPSSAATETKALQRSERERQLAQKEIDYLKARLESFNVEEDGLVEDQNRDKERAEQLRSLETVLQQHKDEIKSLQDEISKLESQPRGTKRSASELESATDDSSSQAAHLRSKNNMLQIALQKTTTQNKQLATELQKGRSKVELLATELSATKSQLKSLRAKNTTRILQLNDNPTSQYEAIKLSTLRTLKQENIDLMSQLQNKSEEIQTVPISSYEALQHDLRDKDFVIADRDKTIARQRKIWQLKADEFRDSITSILGYRVHFEQNGKVKVFSQYYRGVARPPVDDEEDEAVDEREDWIEFDGEKQTMKIGGGAEGAFGQEVRELVDYWIREKREIPCLFAALTLHFYEEYGSAPVPIEDEAE